VSDPIIEENMQTWDNIKEAMDTAGDIGEGWRAVRTISFDRLVGPDGKKLTYEDDLTQIIGTIQKDHGAMEVVPGSIDHGGKVVDFYPVIMDLAIPPEVKGVYTGMGGFSHSSEHGLILEPGLAMHISDVKKVGGKWRVKASIIPRNVLEYMDDFKGMPTSHNVYTDLTKEKKSDISLDNIMNALDGDTVTIDGVVWTKKPGGLWENESGTNISTSSMQMKLQEA